MRTRWLSLALSLALAPGLAGAQPRDHRDDKKAAPDQAPDTRDHRRPAPPSRDDGPGEAPPALKQEAAPAARPGFVWVAGEWDWKNGKYEWVSGHWEREQTGKQWRPSRWEQKDNRWTRVAGGWVDGAAPTPAPPGPPGNDRPRQAPPPPRTEKPGNNRPGFVFVAGEWEWKNGKYEWVAGHWERERPGKQWRPSRWDQRDGEWIRTPGDWADQGAPPPPPPVANTPPGRRPDPTPRAPRKDWKIERPVVSSYWPVKGDAGAKVVIRGRNFPKDAEVLWAGSPIRGVKVTETELRFIVPTGATTGQLAVRAGRGRDLAVGAFEVAAAFDAEAERKKAEEEARKKAEAAWAARQKELAKDKAAREAAIAKRWEEQVASREQRRTSRLEEIRARYQRAFLADPEVQDELDLHAQRVAELVRMGSVAEIKADQKLAVRIEIALTRENERHDQRMAALEAAFKAGGAK
jgi:hypothetical protein